MSRFLNHSSNTNVVTEHRCVPVDKRWTVLSNDPKISRAAINSWWFLINLQLLAFRSSVTVGANSMTAMRRNNSFDSSKKVFIPCPREWQWVVQYRLCSAVTDLFLDVVGNIKSTVPYLYFGKMALEASLCVGLRVIRLRLAQCYPNTGRK